MDRRLPLAFAQALQRRALELIARAGIGSPRKRVVAVLVHFDAGLTCLSQLLADVVQERRRDAERYRSGRGRDHFIDRIVRLLDPSDDLAILVVRRL
jgi:hypothetical protein